ncbi:MAG: hypothetical protein AB9917_16715 [Negativicutes bacterium]
MLNEKLKQYPDKSESRDAERRCGRIGSSDEPAVRAEERRDSVIYTSEIKQPEMGGFNERRKVV